MDSSTPIKAADIVNNPEEVNTLNDHYIIIFDTSWGGTFRNMLKAINLLARTGWEIKSIAHSQGVMYALAQRLTDAAT